jgi:hypothetical protein
MSPKSREKEMRQYTRLLIEKGVFTKRGVFGDGEGSR